MSANTYGQRFQILSFGESHGPALGVVIEGCPAQIPFNEALLIKELARRRPGGKPGVAAIVSDRLEQDQPEILSGVFEKQTLGTPIAIMVRNHDTRPQDYNEIKAVTRPGHADDTWKMKFGHTDHRGGGRSSGRETLARVMGGAVAQMALDKLCPHLRIFAFASSIGPISLTEAEILAVEKEVKSADEVDGFSARLPLATKNKLVEELLLDAKQTGKSFGGEVEVLICGAPQGLGQPVFHKLKSDLAAAFMSIGATAGVELGAGREAIHAEGSVFHREASQRKYGGLRGGISTGENILFRVLFKPTATVLDTAKKGRHDPCIIPRAIPVLEAMARLTILDHILWQRQDRI